MELHCRSFLLNTACEKCRSPCLTCLNQTHCLSCEPDYSIYQNQCFSKCPSGSYQSKQQCSECNPICANCTGNRTSMNSLNFVTPSLFSLRTNRRRLLELRWRIRIQPGGTAMHECLSKRQLFQSGRSSESPCQPRKSRERSRLQLCHLCTNECLERHHPGSYCRQCSYPMSLNSFTHQCLPCCTSNVTTDDCCQCPLIWDGKNLVLDRFSSSLMPVGSLGTCIHPLATASIPSSSWWFRSPLTQIREKFADLNRTSQTVILVSLIVFLCFLFVSLILLTLYVFKNKIFQSESKTKHTDVEYFVLKPLDQPDELNQEAEDERPTESSRFLRDEQWSIVYFSFHLWIDVFQFAIKFSFALVQCTTRRHHLCFVIDGPIRFFSDRFFPLCLSLCICFVSSFSSFHSWRSALTDGSTGDSR